MSLGKVASAVPQELFLESYWLIVSVRSLRDDK